MAAVPPPGEQRDMTRLPTLFWLIMASIAGFAMFAVKYQVQELSDQLVRTVKQADDVERGIRVLDAEWAYLNRPDALSQMNQRFLSLGPIATKQLRADVADIPMRLAPALPPAAPLETVAANAPVADAPAPQIADASSQANLTANAPSPDRAAAEAKPDAPAALDQPRLPRIAKPGSTIKTAFRSVPPRRAASLDELIAQITESR
jgi:hypothetical protein